MHKKRHSKKLWVLCSIIAVYSVSCTRSFSYSEKIPENPSDIKQREISYAPSEPEEYQLPNGLRILYLKDATIPVAQGTLYFPTGSLYDPPSYEGLAQATGSQMREGGITSLTPAELDQKLDRMAASVEAGFSSEYGAVSFRSLSQDFSSVFKIFSEVVLNPAFDDSRLALWKHLNMEAISRRKDNPNAIAAMTTKQLLYGNNSIYGRDPSKDSIQKIKKENILEFYKFYVRPDKAIFSITAPYDFSFIRDEVTKAFANWKPGTKPLPTVPVPGRGREPGVYLVESKFDQATVVLAHFGPQRLAPEMYSMHVFNRIFGQSGFSSMLFSEVRTKQGLAYDVSGGFYPEAKTGTFQVNLGTRVSEVPKAISSVLGVMSEAKNSQIKEEDFSEAIKAVTNNFIFRFSDPRLIVTRKAMFDLLGFSPDYDRNYLYNLKKVNLKKVNQFALDNLDEKNLFIVIVGNVKKKELEKSLDGKFKVHAVSFTDKPIFKESVN